MLPKKIMLNKCSKWQKHYQGNCSKLLFLPKFSGFLEPNMFLRNLYLNIESYQHYTHCVDAFIEQAVQQLVEQGMNDDIFSQVEGIYKMWCRPLSFGLRCGF